MRRLFCVLALSGCSVGKIQDPAQPLPKIDPTLPTTPTDRCRSKDPGRVTLHRLNRAEYDATLRDLFGEDFGLAADFPAEDHGYGFDNIADALSMSPLLFEKYEVAAKSVAERVFSVPPAVPQTQQWEAEQVGASVGGATDEAWNLWTNGEVVQTFTAQAGEYELSARAWGTQFGADPARMQFRIDGQSLGTIDVPATANNPGTYRQRVTLTAGEHRLAVAFINDFYEPPDGDRNLLVDWFAATGPYATETVPTNPALYQKVVTCDAQQDARACAAQSIERFGKRVWRRPLSGEEQARLLTLFDLAQANQDGFEVGMQLVLQALLTSPHFLFRVELDPDPTATTPHPLNDYELAARLSYFLWSSLPDDALFAAAEAGNLHDPQILTEQVRRMLRDPKAEALLQNFVGQWLYTRGLADVNPDSLRYPNWDDALAQAMEAETHHLLRRFLFENRSMLDLFDPGFTYVNDRLAQHYGLSPVDGDAMLEVQLSPDEARGGLLSLGSVLTVTSHPRRTSPVKRGKWVLEQLLCQPPPAPPPNVEALPEPAMPTGSLRERVEAHRADPACAGCHATMDPIGFSMEHFDAIGAFRDDDDGFAIDASGALPGGATFSGVRELARILRADPRVPRCITERAAIYGLGRGPTLADECYLKDVRTEFEASGHTFEGLVTALVKSELFRLRRGEPEGGAE